MPRAGAEFGNDSGADFASQTRLIQVSQEKAPQAARSDFTGKVSLIDLGSNAVSQLLRSRFELAAIAANGCVRNFFAGRAGQ